jgi:hypothetical protein
MLERLQSFKGSYPGDSEEVTTDRSGSENLSRNNPSSSSISHHNRKEKQEPTET